VRFRLIFYYENTPKPEIQKFEQQNCDLLFYVNNLIKGAFCIPDEFGRIPTLVIVYVNGAFFRLAISKTGKCINVGKKEVLLWQKKAEKLDELMNWLKEENRKAHNKQKDCFDINAGFGDLEQQVKIDFIKEVLKLIDDEKDLEEGVKK